MEEMDEIVEEIEEVDEYVIEVEMDELDVEYVKTAQGFIDAQQGAIDRASPRFTGPKDEPFATIWSATCRIVTEGGRGSGFIVGTSPLTIATCAHVVDGARSVTVERPIGGPFREQFAGSVVALDYSGDLAILECNEVHEACENIPLVKLRIRESPYPGEEVIICGYPHGVETPRLAKGLVSGYDSFELDGVTIRGMALDAAVNPGNSGGPVCDLAGRVVGVVFAREKLTSTVSVPRLSKTIRAALSAINANNGIGMALDPADVAPLVNAHKEVRQITNRNFRDYPPAKATIRKDHFVALQVACRRIGRCPIGPFSFDDPQGSFHSGWSTDKDKVSLCAEGWGATLEMVSKTGGSFFIIGNEVILYRKKYKGFIVPAIIEFED